MRWLLCVALVSCGGVETTSLDASATDGASDGTPSCLSLDAAQCRTGPSVVTCIGGVCLADAGGSCGDLDAGCTSSCSSSEYGAACGSPNPTASSAPPSSACRTIGPTPGGVVFYCCPCE